MINFQEKWSSYVPGLHFVIGFSGKFYGIAGNETEKEGDKYIVKNAHKFRWFPHMWSHIIAMRFKDADTLCEYMTSNVDFHKRYVIFERTVGSLFGEVGH